MPYVKLPTGEVIDVPENATPAQLAQLQAILEGNGGSAPAAAAAPARSRAEHLLRQLGLTARAGLTGVTGTVGLVGDALNAGVNLAAGTHLKPVSSSIQDLMDRAGLPKPETGLEKGVNVGATLVAGMMDPAAIATGRALRPDPLYQGTPTPASVRAETVKKAQELGYKMTPAEAGAGGFPRMLGSLADNRTVQAMARERNQPLTDALLRQQAGLPPNTPLTGATLDGAIEAAYQSGYKPIEALGRIPATGPYRRELFKTIDDFYEVNRSFPGALPLRMDDLVRTYDQPAFTGKAAVTATRMLRSDANKAFRSTEPAAEMTGQVQRGISDAIEANIDRYLQLQSRMAALQQGIPAGSTPTVPAGAPPGTSAATLMDNFRNARRLIAKQEVIKDAVLEGAGSGDAMKVAAALNRGAPLTDDLRTIGQFANIAPDAMRLPSGRAPVFTGLENYTMLGGLLSAAHLSPLAATSLLPPLRLALRHGILSGPGQRLLAQPAMASAAPALWPNALPAAFQLGSGLFGQ